MVILNISQMEIEDNDLYECQDLGTHTVQRVSRHFVFGTEHKITYLYRFLKHFHSNI